MDSRKQRKILLINMALAAIIISSIFFVFEVGASYEGLSKGIDLWGEVYSRVLSDYVKDVDPWEVAKDGVEGILKQLDPYSSFFDPRDYKQMHEDSRGEFAGLGIMISTLKDYPTVMESPIDDSPAMRVGLRAGDVIIGIEDESTFEMPINVVVSKLRGKVDTIVNIKVRRGNRSEPLELTIKRAVIPLVNIPFSGEIEEDIGYIKLARFNAEAYEEMEDAIDALLVNENLKGVILDLRYNPGGLLNVARDIANSFLPRGSEIVYTRGLKSNSNNKATLVAGDTPLLPVKPLVVLVNRGSASASEIVAGAIQDYDRGVLIGETTFGKGSVQTLLDLTEGTGLKLTTAYYYTPSGRCIHREENANTGHVAFSQEAEELAGSAKSEQDSMRTGNKFYTRNKNRVVYEGGGVTPDLIIKEKRMGNIVSQLVFQSVFFDFAVLYSEQHPDLPEDFTVTDEMGEEFRAFLDTEKPGSEGNESTKVLDYAIPGKTHLENFRVAVEREKYDDDIVKMIEDMEKSLVERRDVDFDANIDIIKRILKREISATKFGSAAKTIASKNWDIQLKKAIEILQDMEQYNSFLAQGAKTGVAVEQ
ncbi:S41 family peptidase [Candidatus Latescibacterota bacterium]